MIWIDTSTGGSAKPVVRAFWMGDDYLIRSNRSEITRKEYVWESLTGK